MRYITFFILLTLISACAPLSTAEPTSTAALPYRITPDENNYAPQVDDSGRLPAGVTITATALSERYDFTPPRAMLTLSGYMPSVCNELRIKVNPPDENFRIFIEVYSLIDPEIKCDDVFQQFETSVLFGEYSSGRYTVWVNEGLVGDFVAY
ncbi:MAG TPA: hypothetical protein PK078_00460 [Anaerolineales bacterium]|nr:hypothetical protein [Anaerolineales bacterium]HNB35287.1 hypothetical protein [Anaerolineales bacterium]